MEWFPNLPRIQIYIPFSKCSFRSTVHILRKWLISNIVKFQINQQHFFLGDNSKKYLIDRFLFLIFEYTHDILIEQKLTIIDPLLRFISTPPSTAPTPVRLNPLDPRKLPIISHIHDPLISNFFEPNSDRKNNKFRTDTVVLLVMGK